MCAIRIRPGYARRVAKLFIFGLLLLLNLARGDVGRMQSSSKITMTFPAHRDAAATSLALALVAPFALAQPAAAPSNQVIVTATRTPQAASEVLSDTLVIDAEQIAQAGAGSVIDLLQRQRGIEVARNGGAGTSASVYIRGANSNQNIVLIDGVRIGSSTTGAANWSAIPLTAIDRIEIVYGPLSTLYGADAIGGVIQIFTRKGKGGPDLTAFAGYGSDSTREADASISGADKDLSYSISAGKEKSDGFSATRPGSFSYNPDRDGYDKESVAGQFSLQLAPGQELGTVLLHSRLDGQYDSGPAAYDTRSLSTLDHLAFYSRNQILPSWRSLVQVSQARDRSATDASAAASGKSEIETRQTDFTWQNDVRIGADMLQLLYDHRKEQVDSSSTPQLAKDRVTNSFAASYSLKRGAHLINLGARRDRSVYGNRDTGSAGYGYSFNNRLRASASYGTSFRAPTFNELYYPGYGIASNRPERGRNAEAGLHYDDGATQLAAVYYRNRLTDLLVNTLPCPIDPQVNNFGCAYNVNRALLEGWSFAAAHQLGQLRLNGNIDLQDPKDETTGKRLARRARRHANLAAGYVTGPLTGGVEVELAGERFDDAANRNRLGGYGLVNLFATWQMTRDWSALLRWNNIGDKRYDLARNYATPGSKLFAGLRYGYK
jgi:vitamin B12 transporter